MWTMLQVRCWRENSTAPGNGGASSPGPWLTSDLEHPSARLEAVCLLHELGESSGKSGGRGAVNDVVIDRDGEIEHLPRLQAAVQISRFRGDAADGDHQRGGAIGMPQPPPGPNMPMELRPMAPPKRLNQNGFDITARQARDRTGRGMLTAAIVPRSPKAVQHVKLINGAVRPAHKPIWPFLGLW
jgi:hypothetical protein